MKSQSSSSRGDGSCDRDQDRKIRKERDLPARSENSERNRLPSPRRFQCPIHGCHAVQEIKPLTGNTGGIYESDVPPGEREYAYGYDPLLDPYINERLLPPDYDADIMRGPSLYPSDVYTVSRYRRDGKESSLIDRYGPRDVLSPHEILPLRDVISLTGRTEALDEDQYGMLRHQRAPPEWLRTRMEDRDILLGGHRGQGQLSQDGRSRSPAKGPGGNRGAWRKCGGHQDSRNDNRHEDSQKCCCRCIKAFPSMMLGDLIVPPNYSYDDLNEHYDDLFENHFSPTRFQLSVETPRPQNSSESTSGNFDSKFRVMENVKQFPPSKINIKTMDNSVVIHGRHEEHADDGGFVSREFTHQYQLPDNVKPEKVSSSLSKDGTLTIQASRKTLQSPPKNERIIPSTVQRQVAVEEAKTRPGIAVTAVGIAAAAGFAAVAAGIAAIAAGIAAAGSVALLLSGLQPLKKAKLQEQCNRNELQQRQLELQKRRLETQQGHLEIRRLELQQQLELQELKLQKLGSKQSSDQQYCLKMRQWLQQELEIQELNLQGLELRKLELGEKYNRNELRQRRLEQWLEIHQQLYFSS